MTNLTSIEGPRLPKHIEDTFKDARAEALENNATGAIIVIIADDGSKVSYKTFSWGIRNSHALGYLELARHQVYESMLNG